MITDVFSESLAKLKRWYMIYECNLSQSPWEEHAVVSLSFTATESNWKSAIRLKLYSFNLLVQVYVADGPSNELVRKDQVWLKIEHFPTRISITFQEKQFSLWKSLSRKKGRDSEHPRTARHSRRHCGAGVTPAASAFTSPGTRTHTLGHPTTNAAPGPWCIWGCRKDGDIGQGSFLNHHSLDESQQTSMLEFALYSFRKSRAIGKFCSTWQI